MAPLDDTNEAPDMLSSADAATTNQSEDHLHSPSDLDAEIAAIQESDHTRTVHQRIVSTIHDFCMFMSRLSIPEEDILIPPEGGWPTITKENFKKFGKSDSVIEVLRHLTYIAGARDSEKFYDIIPDSMLWNYANDQTLELVQEDNFAMRIGMETEVADLDAGYDPIPKNVVGLVRGGRDTHLIMLDCDTGTIWDHGCNWGGTIYSGWFAHRHGPDSPTVEEYFGDIMEKYRTMFHLPRGNGQIVASCFGDTFNEFEKIKEIYARCGWPDDYRRDECMAALKALRAEVGDD